MPHDLPQEPPDTTPHSTSSKKPKTPSPTPLSPIRTLRRLHPGSALRRLREAFVASSEDMARDVVTDWVEGFATTSEEARKTSTGIGAS